MERAGERRKEKKKEADVAKTATTAVPKQPEVDGNKPKPKKPKLMPAGVVAEKPAELVAGNAEMAGGKKIKKKDFPVEETKRAPVKSDTGESAQQQESEQKKPKTRNTLDVTSTAAAVVEAEAKPVKSEVRDDEVKKKPQGPDTASLFEDALGSMPDFGSNENQEYRPPTRTGFKELPAKDACLMTLLWLPRFFVPWISAWHEFNVYILANPDDLDAKQDDIVRIDLIVFAVACAVSIGVSVIADVASMRYYVYLSMLMVYTLCPIAGGYADVVLRSRRSDKELYSSWLSSVNWMRAAMAIPFAFFPVQFTCIFLQKDNMSRQAHYNWSAFFAFCEFVNWYAAFWVVPAKCPTGEWTQITVWVLILSLLYLLIVLTLTFSIIVKSMRYTMMVCLEKCGFDAGKFFKNGFNKRLKKDRIPKVLRLKKLLWFGLLLIPLVFSSFVFALLERFVPDEDWDKHYIVSASSMFYLGRVIGVVITAVLLYYIRRYGMRIIGRILNFRGDVLIMGLPHVFNVLGLLVLYWRFATLSSLDPTDILLGPLPDETKAFVLFINLMTSNKTVCFRSDHFRPVKVRPFRTAYRELYDPVDMNISVTVDPAASPVVATNFVLRGYSRGEYVVITANSFPIKNLENPENDTEYTDKPRVIRHVNIYLQRFGEAPLKDVRGSLRHRSLVLYLRNFNDPDTKVVVRQGAIPTNRSIFNTVGWQYDETQILVKTETMQWGINYLWCASKRDGYVTRTKDYWELPLYKHKWYVVAAYHVPHMDMNIDYKYRMEHARLSILPLGELVGRDSHPLPAKRMLQRDWAIQVGMTLAGMSAGGLFVGIVYLFWMDPPFPKWQTTSLSVFWVLMMGAAESPKVKAVDIGPKVATSLLVVQIAVTCLHVFAAKKLYSPELNFRKRND